MPLTRVLKIFFHDGCFDGTTSAALFAAFYRDQVAPDTTLVPVGMVHRDGDPFEGLAFDADDHACVDFRFCADPRMTWWFDHHPTAFQPPELRAVFEAEHRPTWVFDPTAPSCAGLIARALAARYQWTPPAHLVEAVRWADTIDAANFSSAAAAIALDNPAQQLAAWLAHGRTKLDTARYVEWLSRHSLAEVAERRELATQLEAIAAERGSELEAVTALGVWHGETVVFDRTGELGARSAGFLGYLLFPTCLYAISATRGMDTIKISVGVNPWSATPRRHDIGALCESLGGGGHASVGGITLHGEELARAQATIAELVRALAT